MTALTSNVRRHAWAGALTSMLLSSAAVAQVAPDAAPVSPVIADEEPGTTGDSGDLVVTGTRIRRPDFESNSPLTSVSNQEIKYQGAVQVENVLNRLPQFTADANDNVSNGSDGTSNINLRNLGSSRVLILVDGRRLMPTQAIDLNFVPSSLIDRIDVVTGGASAVYGSDALSGVVNFVLKDHLDGVRIDGQAGFAQHVNDDDYIHGLLAQKNYVRAPRRVADGGKQDINIAIGKNFLDDRANVTVYGGYRFADPVLQSSRDVSSCALNADGLTNLTCGGSSNTTYGAFRPLAGPSRGQTLLNNPDGTRSFIPYDANYAYNYTPTNYIQRSGCNCTRSSRHRG